MAEVLLLGRVLVFVCGDLLDAKTFGTAQDRFESWGVGRVVLDVCGGRVRMVDVVDCRAECGKVLGACSALSHYAGTFVLVLVGLSVCVGVVCVCMCMCVVCSCVGYVIVRRVWGQTL